MQRLTDSGSNTDPVSRARMALAATRARQAQIIKNQHPSLRNLGPAIKMALDPRPMIGQAVHDMTHPVAFAERGLKGYQKGLVPGALAAMMEPTVSKIPLAAPIPGGAMAKGAHFAEDAMKAEAFMNKSAVFSNRIKSLTGNASHVANGSPWSKGADIAFSSHAANTDRNYQNGLDILKSRAHGPQGDKFPTSPALDRNYGNAQAILAGSPGKTPSLKDMPEQLAKMIANGFMGHEGGPVSLGTSMAREGAAGPRDVLAAFKGLRPKTLNAQQGHDLGALLQGTDHPDEFTPSAQDSLMERYARATEPTPGTDPTLAAHIDPALLRQMGIVDSEPLTTSHVSQAMNKNYGHGYPNTPKSKQALQQMLIELMKNAQR